MYGEIIGNKMTLCEPDDCTGCGACRTACPKQCIALLPDGEGFDRPQIDAARCIACGRCRQVCPVLTPPRRATRPDPDVWLGWVRSREVLEQSTSGGLFSALAQPVLARGGTVFGVVMEAGCRARTVAARTAGELAPMRGSKYVQADTGTSYDAARRELRAGHPVLFTGTPCQIAGLYGFLGREADDPRLVTCEVICHGIPSPKYLQAYVARYAPLADARITFRNGRTWSYETRCRTACRNERWGAARDYYVRSFLRGLCFRESCYRCPFARMPRVADLTLGDFWGVARQVPGCRCNPRGNSLLLSNSPQGTALLEACMPQLDLQRCTLGQALASNPRLAAPAVRPAARTDFYTDFFELPPAEFLRKYRLQATLRNRLGQLRRRLRALLLRLHEPFSSPCL